MAGDWELCGWRRNGWNGTVRTGTGTEVLSERVGFLGRKRSVSIGNVEVRNRDCAVCSCRHSEASVCVRSMNCVWRLYCVQL